MMSMLLFYVTFFFFPSQVSPDVLALYNVVETNFKPMSIVKDAQPYLADMAKSTNKDVAR